MRALRLESNGLTLHTDWPIPTLEEGEALVRIHLAGICSTDLEIAKGYFGFQGTLGHEFVGTVEQVKSSESESQNWIGQRAVASINFANRFSSEYATYGLEHHPRRNVLGILNWDGAMADFVRVPIDNLFEVPDNVSDRQAVFTEPLAAALRIPQQITLDPNYRICLIGPGRLGMLIARVLERTGCCVTVVGRSERSLELARKWGIATGRADDFENSSFDIVVDATGNAQGLAEAVRLTRPLGQLVLKSTFEQQGQTDLTKVVVDEIQIVGSRCGPFSAAIRMLKSGDLCTEDLIDGEYNIEQSIEAFEFAAQPSIRKVLLSFDS
ncbi:MAG: alcohol dehydrogenase catalytic domain-containing protein [Planctomycetota bacterium]